MNKDKKTQIMKNIACFLKEHVGYVDVENEEICIDGWLTYDDMLKIATIINEHGHE